MHQSKKQCFSVLAIFLSISLNARTYKHDFGTIKEDGGMVSHVFTLDASKSDYTIVQSIPSCACMKADVPRTTVKRGAKAKVTVLYDPQRQHTHFTKSVYIKRSDGVRDTLQVSGTVKMTREPVDKKKYPADYGYGLRLATNGITCGTMHPGGSRQIKTAMLNAFEAGMGVDFKVTGRDAAMVEVPCGYKLAPLGEGTLVVNIKIPSGFKGKSIQASLQPIVNGSKTNPIPVYVKL